jgi:hypothetical protein
MATVAENFPEQGGDNSTKIREIDFVVYRDESLLESVMSLVGRDLSEPYSSKTDYRTCFFLVISLVHLIHLLLQVFTYRYFLHRFPELCILAVDKDNPTEPIGCVVGKVDTEETIVNGKVQKVKTGYVGCQCDAPPIRNRHGTRQASSTEDARDWMHLGDSRNRSIQQSSTETISRNLWIYTRRVVGAILSQLGRCISIATMVVLKTQDRQFRSLTRERRKSALYSMEVV